MSDSGIFGTLVLALWSLGKANNDNITIKERIFTTNHKSKKCRQKVLQIFVQVKLETDKYDKMNAPLVTVHCLLILTISRHLTRYILYKHICLIQNMVKRTL